MGYVNGDGILAFILMKFCMLYHSIITSLNHKASWKMIILLANLQKQKIYMLNYAQQELKFFFVNTTKSRKNNNLPCFH
jgi:hypothetical protein